ncbi:hypothetical protein HPP92_016969 [Vanilla planifolia]|uniref:SBP-type domain-containing protein n=1 Tax=Vanilla planifolia TaxID=51239 RepID=A0A835QJ33_VANPL|nr:hypothetical protein HPP92_017549 [Vanilla planifolia]KAG0472423.1 hypothetical protein HPP92_016969 [Vanilla planifolia]
MEKNPLESRRSAKEQALAASTEAAAAMEEGDAEGNEEGGSERLRRTLTALAVARGRTGVGGGGVSFPICQAEKCLADLTEAKRYHRRHKVCEAHAKASVVIVAGLRQRFCQQCSRFHELSEFDDTKRSCRRRLAGHNERRRKSSSDAHGEASSNCLQSDQSGKLPISLPGDSNYKHFQIR